MASAYDYPNARIRGLQGDLLKPAEFEHLATRNDLYELVAALASTDYGPDLEQAGRQAMGMALVEEALRGNLCRRLLGLRAFFEPPPGVLSDEPYELVETLLARYDLRNLVAILRAKAAGVAADQIPPSLVVAGRLSAHQLGELAQAVDVQSFVARLESWRMPYAQSLTRLLAAGPNQPGLPSVELALRQGFHDWAMPRLRHGSANAALVSDLLRLEVDGFNLLAVMRLIDRGIHLPAAALEAQILKGGAIPLERIAAFAAQPGLREAISAAGRPWQRVLSAALGDSAPSDDAIAVEWAVESYFARWAKAQVYRDPTGIALAVGYQVSKAEEVRKLRVIARAIPARWPQERLRQMMAAGAAKVVQWQTS